MLTPWAGFCSAQDAVFASAHAVAPLLGPKVRAPSLGCATAPVTYFYPGQLRRADSRGQRWIIGAFIRPDPDLGTPPLLLISMHPAVASRSFHESRLVVSAVAGMVGTLSRNEFGVHECVLGPAWLGDVVRSDRKRGRRGGASRQLCTKVLSDAASHLKSMRARVSDDPRTWIEVSVFVGGRVTD